MAQTKRRRVPQPRQRPDPTRPAESSDDTGLALIASALRNIAQASKNPDLEREREQLEAVLREWQQAYLRLEERARTVRAAYQEVSAQLEASERERQQWHLKYLACEKELKARRAPSSKEKEKR